jgi:site-specific recombinase XerD
MHAIRERAPAQVKVGNVSIPIFQWGDGRWWVRWREDGRIHKRPYRSLERAKALARVVATRLNNGLPSLADLTAADRQLYAYATRTAKEQGFTLTAAIDDWVRLRLNAPENKPRITLDAFLDAFLTDKRDHRLSARYMRGLKRDLEKFRDAFPARPIQSITAEEIKTYLRAMVTAEKEPIGLRRRNNIRDEIVTFFAAAKKAGHLPEDRATEAEKVDRIELDDWTPTTYTPAELRLLLDHVTREWMPWLCIAAFAGMRSEEIACVHETKKGEKRQLLWSDFKWDRRKIDVPAVITKDRRRRLVPISDQLAAWLAPWASAHGPVCPPQRLNATTGRVVKDRYDREIDRLKVASGVAWKNDALRHSFCSYWLSLHHDIHELSRLVGNSPAIIKKHYEDAKYSEEAAQWFGILPDRPGNVLQIPATHP